MDFQLSEEQNLIRVMSTSQEAPSRVAHPSSVGPAT